MWYEIDDIQDLDIASSIFTPTEDIKIQNLAKRYGGYWRYPKLLDFCYLVNPYFPPARLLDEIKANLDKLIVDYPSGQGVNSLLAAKNFGIKQAYVAVGNGAAELIKEILQNIDGSIGVIRPTFDEYPNRLHKDKIVEYFPENFKYGYQDIKHHFEEHPVSCILIINPDNPTGNYIPKYDILKLFDWSMKRNIKIVIDESFIDFADEENNSSLDNKLLESYKNVIVIKSISKSYGIPGLRLGIVASANINFISEIRRNLSIWNINSLAEFYMQIYEKYKQDYIDALIRFREERKRFSKELELIPHLKIYETQANFFMCELIDGYQVIELQKKLLTQFNILIKDLGSKNGCSRHLLRISIRNKTDNNLLISALRELLC